ncbi:MAG: translation initiation factor IF-2 [Promethearchaeota archaeon]
MAKNLLNQFKIKVTIPGLLVVDSPGHAAFMNLRRRAGSVCDIAILVIDVLAGFQPQTHESVNILKERNTPFLVAANKIDRVPGWKDKESTSFLESIKKQEDYVKKNLDQKIYEIVGAFSTIGFESERFDRVGDFAKTIAIVPTSANTGEGIAELLMVIAGLTQQYMMKRLEISSKEGRGTVLEVKEEPGLGITVDTVIYDGIVRKGDSIVVGSLSDPVVTKIRALLLPKPLDEIRDPRERFDPVKEVSAAAGVKIAAPALEGAIAGAPLIVANTEKEIEEAKEEILGEIEKIRISTDKAGIILKADTLGSLEAISKYLQDQGIAVRIADVGDISKRDIVEAEVVKERDPLSAIILGFNVKVLPDAKEEAVKYEIPILQEKIIYRLFEEYENWLFERREERKREALKTAVKPGKVKIIPEYIFRQSKPAIVGVNVLGGQMVSKVYLIKQDGSRVGLVLQIQDKGETVASAKAGQAVAISIKGATVGRQINEDDVLYVDVPEKDVKLFKERFKDELSVDELEVLDELIEIKRKASPMWGA